jgi:hypothetical protein
MRNWFQAFAFKFNFVPLRYGAAGSRSGEVGPAQLLNSVCKFAQLSNPVCTAVESSLHSC